MAIQKDEVNQFIVRLDEQDATRVVDAMLTYAESIVSDIRLYMDEIEVGITDCCEMPDHVQIERIEKTIADLKMARELSRALILWINGHCDEHGRDENVGLHFNPIP
jgi:hypothetical protein